MQWLFHHHSKKIDIHIPMNFESKTASQLNFEVFDCDLKHMMIGYGGQG